MSILRIDKRMKRHLRNYIKGILATCAICKCVYKKLKTNEFTTNIQKEKP